MVDVNNCNNQAAKLEEAAVNIGSIITIYEDAYDEIKNNKSSQVDNIKNEYKTKISVLQNIKNDLNSSASTIRTKAQEIYNKQKAEEEAKAKAAQNN